ncbi:zinc-dependent metalloprotease [Microbacterium aerolatum]|uniref:Hydrolase n=1 Tax=Microbacterium aerolatum TaxID=153731 RepID=A0A511A9N2_9MICO|nr:zinc-dependent metalloprotease [Microbacterium aerolatum]MCK3770172.1 zinc-dependent metalloprotease [Microbacterium aerolatum]GEK84910.1 hydrolase [Microbacterium aerolatum]GGB37142.1 hydrolase [Microbacterium aerolatum]
MADNDPNPEDFQEFLRRMMSGAGAGDFDLDALQNALGGADGIQLDPAMMAALSQQLQNVFGGDPWENTLRQALHIANREGQGITDGSRHSLVDAFALANLWLGEATTISELSDSPQAMTRGEWVEKTLPVWKDIAGPVSTSIADALTSALDTQVPEDMRDAIQGAGKLMRGLGASVFAAQFGQVLGNLSLEVVSGGDVGIPVLPAGTAAVIPQNITAFGEGLEIPEDQITLYLATRELAYARLYRHAKWLHLQVMSQITDFARGVTVDVDALEDVASRLDPSNPEELRAAIEGGALLPAQTDAQRESLGRLENIVAMIDGWVDVVTSEATSRLPDGVRLAEAARRRRAVGGPAEDALGALVGLKLRPRRMREAAEMWRKVTDAVGVAARDSLWDYPDLLPTAADIDDPSALIDRLQARSRGEEPVADEFDEALARLLDGDDFAVGKGDEPGDDGASREDGEEDGGSASGEGEKPV